MKRIYMRYRNRNQWKHRLTGMVLLAMALGGSVQAMPSGGTIRSGNGSIVEQGQTMTVQQNSNRMAIDWTQFNIAKNETIRYTQPDKNAVALNRVTGGQQSLIEGNLNANGHVFLVNPNGVVFGKNASVDVGGLVASTARLADDTMNHFGSSQDSLNLAVDNENNAAVINEGIIRAQGGLVALHASNVENSGTITDDGGTVALTAAKNLNLSSDADGKLNFTVDGTMARAQSLNSGTLKADGGYVVMTAKSAGDVLSTVVNNSGTIEAKTLRKNEKGQVLLDGGDNGQVEVSGTLDASGTEEGQDAGSIKAIGQKTIVHDGTQLLARGNVNGGTIETSGDVLNLGNSLNIDAKGITGKAGEWLLDPLDVIIADNDPTTTSNYENSEKKTAADSDFTNGSASIGYNDPDATTANASSVNSAVTWISTDMVEKMLNAGTNVTIQAAATNGSANIIVKNDIDKTAGDDATFTLDAMRNITVNGNITSTAGKLNVVLNADSNGDQIGAVIINANINTNGGDFTSASGGTVKYTSDSANTKGYGKGTLTGKADPAGHTVGTYFGHVDSSGTADGAKDDRLIKTSGGKITLNGEIAIGLNGGTLTLDSGGGDVTATGIINSGNSYGAYVYGTDTWDTLVEKTVESYLKSGTVPAYHYQGVNYVKNSDGTYAKNADGTYKTTTDTADFSNGEPHYTFDKETDTQNIRWLGDGSSTAVSVTKGKGYSSVIITEGKMSTKEYLQYVAVSDPEGFLSRYMTSDPAITVVSTSYTLTVGSVNVNGVSNNALGYKVGNNFTALTQAQIQSLADSALTFAKNSTDTTKMNNGSTAYTNLTNDIKQLIASNWFVSESLAKYNPKTKTYNEGKSAVGDSYLATITTVLENSLTTPNGQQYLWVGGRGSGVLNKTGSTNNDKLYPYSYWGMPDDPTYQDGMYWVTGPEGEANNGKGTQFYSNAGSDWSTVSLGSDGKTYTYNKGSNVYGYVNWDTWTDKATATDKKRVDVTRSQPDNSSPFLTVGYGTHGKWDDGAMGGATTVGFVKETNLANSSLNIRAGSGTVSLEGDIGKSKALDTVNIESTGAVTIGNEKNTATNYKYGTIYADHGVYLSGGTVTVGGEIHSGTTDTTSSASDIATRTDGYQNTAFQLDNVTIKSAGDLTVHGIASDGYTDSDDTLHGGKISLTSTGDKGRITLGAGVDYNGNATNGTLAAANTAKGAVVVDAQGSQGSLVNSTAGTDAITTGTGGTWQVYVNSPSDYGTSLGDNLISGTNAQWTAKSDANSTVFGNSSGNTLTDYKDTSSNKFIFQVTPVITITGGYASKTYGDTLSEETMAKTLTSKAAYKDSSGNNIDVTSFKNFDESSYLNYVTSSDGTKTGLATVSASSDGAAQTATRTSGNEMVTDADGNKTYKTARDGNKAFYVMDVAYQDGVKTLNGYDKAANDGEVEITWKTLNISTDGTQTYGNTTVTNGMPSYDKNQLVNGDTLSDSDIKYTISTDGTYATSKGSNDTAHVGKYEGQYLTSSAEVKASDGSDASANYEVTGSGTITVNPADLYLTVGDVSTTYGTAFNTDKYTYTIDTAKGGLVNGDSQASVLGDRFLNYTNTGAKTDADNDKVKTQNAGTYALQGAASKDLSDYTVHITNGKSTVEKAKLTLKVGDTSTTYGSNDWTPYTYTLSGNANGDSEDDVRNNQIEVSYSNGGEKADSSNSDVKTQDVGDYNLTGTFTLKGDTAKNYEIDKENSDLTGTATVNKATVKVKLNDVSTTYGTAFDTSKYGYDASNIKGLTNGDGTDVVTNVLDGTYGTGNITYTNTGDASEAEKQAGKVTKTVNGGRYYLQGTTSQTLNNYNIEIEDGNAAIDKATLHLSTGDYTEAYGDAGAVQKDLDSATTVKGEKNGDSLAELTSEIGITNTSGALVSKDRTNDVKYKTDGSLDSYGITTDFNKSLDNYEVVLDKKGSVTLTPVAIKVTNDMIQTYGSDKRTFTESSNPNLVNGDTISTDGLTMTPKAGGAYETNRAGRTTADAGTYYNDLESDGGGIVHENGSDARKNYIVTIEGDIIVNKAPLRIDTDDVFTPYGVVRTTQSRVTGLTNGDQPGGLNYDYGDYGHGYLNGNTRTNWPGTYSFGTLLSGPDFLKNYLVSGGDATLQIVQTKPDITNQDVWKRDGGRPQHKVEVSMPIFRVKDNTVKQYGTYGVSQAGETTKLSPTGMRLTEPVQPQLHNRSIKTNLQTEDGSGMFRLDYDGVTLRIYPLDDGAQYVVKAGDAKKNVALSEKAIHVAFTEMGLDLVRLKGVYVYFADPVV